MKKEEQEECIKLLKECNQLIFLIPNRGYRGEYSSSYLLGYGIQQFLNKIDGKGKKI